MKKFKHKWWILGFLSILSMTAIFLLLSAYANQLHLTDEKIANYILTTVVVIFAVLLIRNLSGNQQKSQKYKVIEKTDVTFRDIAGMEEVKKEVQIYIDIMRNHEEYVKFGVRIPKGIILEGSPGNGKTLIAKAIASEMNVSFLQANAADIGGILVGKGSQDLKKLFQHARKNKPCIVFLDEIDAIGRKRSDHQSDAGNDGNRTVTSLLTELDGFDDNEGIFVIAATNRIDAMDDALVRPGRFDRKITIKNPDHKTRKELITMYTKNKLLSSDVNLDDLAWKFSGFSCAEIENNINEAAIYTLRHNRTYITARDFEQTMIQQRIKGYLLNDEEEIYQRELTAYHEAGHALVTYELTEDVVDIISIVPTTSQVKGFTMSYATEDRNLLSLQEIKHRIMILMAGRAAEYLLLDEDENRVTTGCSDDMNRAVDLMKLYIRTTTKGISYNQGNARTQSEVFHQELRCLSQEMWEETLSYLRNHWSLVTCLAEELVETKWVTKHRIIELLTIEQKKDA